MRPFGPGSERELLVKLAFGAVNRLVWRFFGSRWQKVSVDEPIQALQHRRKHISGLQDFMKQVFDIRNFSAIRLEVDTGQDVTGTNIEVLNMDSFEFNKVAMAFLGAVFAIFSLTLLSESIFHSEVPEQAGYEIATAEGSSGDSGAVASGPAYEPIEALLASADLAAGETVFKKCASCHTWEKGGANKVGPNLWNVVGSTIGNHNAEFGYSAALKTYGESGKSWTYEELNGFFFKPKSHVKGTAMGFAGLKKTEDRANLIGWLRTHSDAPVPLPGS